MRPLDLCTLRCSLGSSVASKPNRGEEEGGFGLVPVDEERVAGGGGEVGVVHGQEEKGAAEERMG